LFHALQRHAAQHGGCYIILTGDYHYSDVKVAQPGSGNVYSEAYQTANWTTPLYQVCGECLALQLQGAAVAVAAVLR
jgi:hypothetical protein